MDRVNKLSRVDKWFLRKVETLLAMERRLVVSELTAGASEDVNSLIGDAFLMGFPSPTIRSLLKGNQEKLEFALRVDAEIERQKAMPVFKMVDTCAGEFESQTPYYYGTFEQEDDAVIPAKGE